MKGRFLGAPMRDLWAEINACLILENQCPSRYNTIWPDSLGNSVGTGTSEREEKGGSIGTVALNFRSYYITEKLAFFCSAEIRESSFDMTRGRGGGGGRRFRNSKLEILAAPIASGSMFQEPLPPFGSKTFRAPLLAQQFFQSPPIQVSKKFSEPPPPLNIFIPPPLVILNELYLRPRY